MQTSRFGKVTTLTIGGVGVVFAKQLTRMASPDLLYGEIPPAACLRQPPATTGKRFLPAALTAVTVKMVGASTRLPIDLPIARKRPCNGRSSRDRRRVAPIQRLRTRLSSTRSTIQKARKSPKVRRH